MRLVVGRIGRAHGVRGEATIEIRTDDPDDRFAIGSILHTEPEERGPLTVASGRVHNGILLLSFEGYHDRTAVETLRNTLLVADVDIEQGEDEDEFHDLVLIGMSVATLDGVEVGTVDDVVHLPAQDLLSVMTPEGRELLIPFVHQIVPTVDRTARRILIDPPPGLLAAEEGGQ
jgi:16S rRNA processing protein RimM